MIWPRKRLIKVAYQYLLYSHYLIFLIRYDNTNTMNNSLYGTHECKSACVLAGSCRKLFHLTLAIRLVGAIVHIYRVILCLYRRNNTRIVLYINICNCLSMARKQTITNFPPSYWRFRRLNGESGGRRLKRHNRYYYIDSLLILVELNDL